MANHCAGVTVTWGGVNFGEVTSVKATVGGALPLGRSCNYTPDPGLVDIACLTTAGLSGTSYGIMATLSLAGGGLNVGGGTAFTTKAILQRLECTGTVNDITRYAATLRLVSMAGTAVSS